MSTTGSDLTPLERAVLQEISQMNVEDQAALNLQVSTITIINRENTGAGSYTHCAVDRASTPAVEGDRLRHGPVARVTGLEHGMGFILWLKDGYIDHLEGFSYSESTTQVDFERAAFEVARD
jgi:hypothetical protein